MREILFRGKTDRSEWVVGNLMVYYDRSASIIESSTSLNTFHVVFPETVGQYIGVEDKNGNRVFEGDILRYTPRPKCTIYYKVIWNQEWSRFALVQWSTHKYQIYEWAEFSKVKYSCEVIGNIHDNPDLLESLESN